MANEIDVTTGAVIRRLRERAGMTQEVLASRIGKSYQQVQKYEKGTNRISISVFFKIAEVLKQKPHSLLQFVEFELEGDFE